VPGEIDLRFLVACSRPQPHGPCMPATTSTSLRSPYNRPCYAAGGPAVLELVFFLFFLLLCIPTFVQVRPPPHFVVAVIFDALRHTHVRMLAKINLRACCGAWKYFMVVYALGVCASSILRRGAHSACSVIFLSFFLRCTLHVTHDWQGQALVLCCTVSTA
jgi:hypothetical protein